MTHLPPALLVSEVSKTYANGVNALSKVSLSVPAGGFFGLLGPNGAGKTTLIGSFTGLVNKTSGRIVVSGYDIDTNPTEARSCIGVVSQEFNFNIFRPVERILLDNAGYHGVGRRVAKIRAAHWLKTLGLWEKRKTKVIALSGGMKRRLMLARAMMHNPNILVLDEPTAGVDIELRLSLWELIKKINHTEGVTVILTTHYLEEAENLCEQVAIIDRGQLIENSPIDQLLERVSIERFVLSLASPMPEQIDLSPFIYQRLGATTLEVSINKTQSLNDLFLMLSNHKIIVHSIKNKRNRLEQLFIELTEK